MSGKDRVAQEPSEEVCTGACGRKGSLLVNLGTEWPAWRVFSSLSPQPLQGVSVHRERVALMMGME